MPEYEILKPVSRKSIYDALPGSPPGAKCAEALRRYETFDNYFSNDLYSFSAKISLSQLLDWFLGHPADLQWLIEQGFIGIVQPAFVPFKLPIETEEEAKTIWYLLEAALRVSPDCLANVWLRLNALYSPKEVDHA